MRHDFIILPVDWLMCICYQGMPEAWARLLHTSNITQAEQKKNPQVCDLEIITLIFNYTVNMYCFNRVMQVLVKGHLYHRVSIRNLRESTHQGSYTNMYT